MLEGILNNAGYVAFVLVLVGIGTIAYTGVFESIRDSWQRWRHRQ